MGLYTSLLYYNLYIYYMIINDSSWTTALKTNISRSSLFTLLLKYYRYLQREHGLNRIYYWLVYSHVIVDRISLVKKSYKLLFFRRKEEKQNNTSLYTIAPYSLYIYIMLNLRTYYSVVVLRAFVYHVLFNFVCE